MRRRERVAKVTGSTALGERDPPKKAEKLARYLLADWLQLGCNLLQSYNPLVLP
jgi:hypothetical protein